MKSVILYVHIPTQRIGNNSSCSDTLYAVFEFDPLHSACMKHGWKKPEPYVCTNVFPDSFFTSNQPNSCFCVITAPNRPTTPLTTGALMPPPRPSSRPKLPTGKLTGINEIVSLHPRVCSGTTVYVCNPALFGRFPPPRYGRSAPLRCPMPALPRLPHSPEQRALLRCPQTPRSVLGPPRLLVRFH